jgi:hypothetical protein
MSKKSLKKIRYGKHAELGMLWFIYEEQRHFLIDIMLPDRMIQLVTGSLEGALEIVKSYQKERELEIKK